LLCYENKKQVPLRVFLLGKKVEGCCVVTCYYYLFSATLDAALRLYSTFFVIPLLCYENKKQFPLRVLVVAESMSVL
jgi:hypothetical protein